MTIKAFIGLAILLGMVILAFIESRKTARSNRIDKACGSPLDWSKIDSGK